MASGALAWLFVIQYYWTGNVTLNQPPATVTNIETTKILEATYHPNGELDVSQCPSENIFTCIYDLYESIPTSTTP